MNTFTRIHIVFFLSIFFLMSSTTASDRPSISEPQVSQIFRNIAEITDRASIEWILDDFLIAEDPDQVERLEVIDVSNIGFGRDDIVVVYPSLNVYIVEQPSPELAEIMRSWGIREQRRDASNELSPDYFYPSFADTLSEMEINERQTELVQGSIIADLLESINRNYTDMPISLRFERDEEGFTFQIWNYDRDAFAFHPRPPAAPDSVGVYDFLYLVASDTVMIADTVMYDIMFINRSVQEVIELPPTPADLQEIRTTSLP